MDELLETGVEEVIKATQFCDMVGLENLLLRFTINIIVLCTIIQCFYYPKSKRRDFNFTFTLIGISIFMLMFLMGGVKLKVGVALGLFAIFGIIRYRTEAVPIREMTYLFLIIAVSAINAMSEGFSWVEVIVVNILFILSIWACEGAKWLKHVSCKYVKYDNINLITPDKEKELIADLEKRTGLNVVRVEVGSIDFLRDCALVKMYYDDKGETVNTTDTTSKLPKMYD